MTLASIDQRHLSQRELEQTLWAAANALRGPVDPGDFKAYVFPVLFYKWISDAYDYHHGQAVSDLGDEWTQEIEDEDYQTFLIPDGTHWDATYEVTKNPGAALNRALVAIQEANPGKLAGVFGDVNWANTERIPESALKSLLGVFNRLTLDPAHVSGDMLGSAYEYLLREFAEASGRKAGEFFTPRHVVHLLVKILAPEAGDSICDPACGSAGMLVETVEAVKLHGGNPESLLLYGQEQNLTTAGIARMNLYLHGLEDFEIKRGDTFREPKLLDESGRLRKFDVVIANPPFSLDNWPATTWAQDPFKRALGGIVPPAKKGDWAWIQHMLSTMRDETGRVGVVMPHGVLFRSDSTSEPAMRKYVVENDLLDAVIGLPNNLFYSTTIPVCLLIFRAKKPVEREDHVLFIDARARFKPGKNQNTMSDDDIEIIDAAYKTGNDTDGDSGLNLQLVPKFDIEKNGYDLNLGRYVQAETEAEADVDAALAALREAQERMDATRAALDIRLKEAGFYA
ncbi:type I restriction-modification system subunit M [Agromyces binzhouensis]|uniref:site-specific DNA-methyltransferase (adenine-specific) n=1 Tax=Agromyces binzhouensis TaxID=1817495 RepID=A0A4Q2JYE6_9MICO|nr:class I SAM-dependent DNA methyltransferase [Agromyces binzhouensis]RXZ51897.1 SAM-dependent DNA methyltransferase [Agromyces binzhouensis]